MILPQNDGVSRFYPTDVHFRPAQPLPAYVASMLERCHACFRLIQPGQTYYLTIGQAILCESCLGIANAIRVTDDLAVLVEEGRLLVRRSGSTVEILPHEVRHLVHALVEGAGRLVDGQIRK